MISKQSLNITKAENNKLVKDKVNIEFLIISFNLFFESKIIIMIPDVNKDQ